MSKIKENLHEKSEQQKTISNNSSRTRNKAFAILLDTGYSVYGIRVVKRY